MLIFKWLLGAEFISPARDWWIYSCTGWVRKDSITEQEIEELKKSKTSFPN